MRQTLLEITQLILSSMDGEEINTLGDTTEANQVALLVKNCYYDMIAEIRMPEHETLFQLEPSLDLTKPCLMYVPSNVTKLNTVRYNYTTDDGATPDYRYVTAVTFEDYMQRQSGFEPTDSSVDTMEITFDGNAYKFFYRTDKMPQYYTTADDNQLLFDSFDIAEDTTLQKAKTMCTGNSYPVFSLTDSFTPDLDPTQFPLFINKCKVRAFNELRQQVNQEAASEARRQKIQVQKRKLKTEDVPAVMTHSRYGRK